MEKSVKRVAFAVATHPSTVKLCALYTFRLLRRLRREAERSSYRARSIVEEVHEAWTESGHEAKR